MAGRLKIPISEVVERLESAYGSPPPRKPLDPIEELVACILSQHTTDRSSFPAYDRLRERFATWDALLEAGQEEVAAVIRQAGLANQKSRTIVTCLSLIRERVGSFSLAHLVGMEPKAARAWLVALPGVGPKTASIVLCFSLGMPVVPVDTHVHRVSMKIGAIPETMSADPAHDALLESVPSELAYRFHMALIEHGRRVCRAQRPACEVCVLAEACVWYAESRGYPRASEAKRRKS